MFLNRWNNFVSLVGHNDRFRLKINEYIRNVESSRDSSLECLVEISE